MPINVSKTIRKANSLAKRGELAAAAELYDAVLAQFPQNKQAAQGLASLGKAQAPATAQSRQQLQQDLQHLVALFNQGQFQHALELGGLLARQHPEQPLVFNVLGAAQKSLRNYDQAIANLKIAVRLQPDYAEAYSNLGAAYHDIRMYSEAVAAHKKAIRHAPDFVEAHYNLGSALTECGKREQAIAAYSEALRIKPDHAMALGGLLFQLAQVCDWDAIEPYRESLPALGTSGEKVHPFGLLPLDDNPANHRKRAEVYTRQTFTQQELPLTRPDARPRRLRIGYFSADFHGHATMYLMARMFELHDKEKFVVHAYSYGANHDDSMRTRLVESVDEFFELASLGDKEIAELCRSHAIDIAVDLKGYTQYSRPGIFAYRAAPVQISYLGYPGTSGAPFIDYIIADPVVIPRGEECHYSEKIIYLPHSYQVNDSSREIAPVAPTRAAAGLPEEGFVFCCFNNSYKIGPREFDIWMRLLQQVQGSVLWLFSSDELAQQNLQKQAVKRGVDPQRLVFAARLPQAEHLARHALADLFLDTFNCNAHTTASDALWAGLPVVTRMGASFAARVAGSLLSALGLLELVTNSESEYEQLALDLARESERLQVIKSRLAENRLTAALFDAALSTRCIEKAYEQAYQQYWDDKEPDTLTITT